MKTKKRNPYSSPAETSIIPATSYGGLWKAWIEEEFGHLEPKKKKTPVKTKRVKRV